MNAFEVLGLNTDADQESVKAAYRTRVKLCHPDQFIDQKQQTKAQEQLIQLNLAYEEALRLSAQKQVGFHSVSCAEATAFALRLFEQGKYESALRQLGRAETKDGEFYYLEGRILFAMKQYSSAHQAYREAVRFAPDNLAYRRGALDAALAYKKHSQIGYRVLDWADGLFRPRKKM